MSPENPAPLDADAPGGGRARPDRRKTRIAVLGCGAVSHMYLPNLVESPVLELAGVADLDAGLATRVAEQYGARAIAPEELMADETIELVVNLTPIRAHVDTTRRLLDSGKHVYSEKSLAPGYADALSLAGHAKRKGLTLAVAPDTLLGTGFSVARERLDGGVVGRPAFASAVLVRSKMAAPSWYSAEATPLFDMAPYYVTALISIFGPAREVHAVTRLWPAGTMPSESPAGAQLGADAIIGFDSGATATLTLAWTSTTPEPETTRLDVFGSEGILHFPNPNTFGDPAYVTRYGEEERRELPLSRQPDTFRSNLRGLGIAEAAVAIAEDRSPLCSADLAVHVVEIIEAIDLAAARRAPVTIRSTVERPATLSAEARAQLLPAPAAALHH